MKKKNPEFPVKFFKGTAEQYASIIPNMYTFYFITDTNKVYLGDIEISNRDIAERIDYINQQLADMQQQLDEKATIKIKTTSQWDSDLSLVSQKGTVYIYSDRQQVEDEHGNITYIPGIKIGDGLAFLVDLPFVDELFYRHIYNSDIHVTLGEKAFWNNKLNVNDAQEVIQDTLVFNRN